MAFGSAFLLLTAFSILLIFFGDQPPVGSVLFVMAIMALVVAIKMHLQVDKQRILIPLSVGKGDKKATPQELK